MKFAMLRAAIMGAGYQHSEFAKKVGICPASFSQRMSGKRPFGLDEAYRIMDVLGLPYKELPTYFPKGGKI